MTDGRSGAYSVTGLPDGAEIAWVADLGCPVYALPVLTGDTLLAGDSLGRVHALDAATGERRWRFPDRDYDLDADDDYKTVVTVWRDEVIVGVCGEFDYFDTYADAGYDDDEEFEADEFEDGDEEQFEDFIDEQISILDLRSGKLLRTAPRDWYPSVVGDRLVLISLNGGVRAVTLPDLTPLWWNRDANGRVQTSPAAGPGDLIYLSGGREANRTHGGLVALDLHTGETRFEYKPEEEVFAETGPPHAVAAEGLVWKPVLRYEEDERPEHPGEIVGLDPLTGEKRWSHLVKGRPDGSVAVADGTVCFAVSGGEDGIHAVDIKTRRTLWTRKLPGAGVGTPVLASGVLYTATGKGTVLALDAATGEQRWALDLGEYIDDKELDNEALYDEIPPAVLPADGMLYVRTSTGVVALRQRS
jgi:outer membrane protein assembly factor BamB